MPALLLLSCVLTGCAGVPSRSAASSPLYQPPVLRLPAGQPVQTTDGVHTPAADETWHSDARFRALEQENLNLLRANTDLRSR